MARLYTNEKFYYSVANALKELGHDVLTTKDAGNANQAIPDEEVLDFAIAENRTILTFNRRDFIYLHRQRPEHSGIIVCKEDKDLEGLTSRIHEAIKFEKNLKNKLIRINRPNPSQKEA